MTPPLTRVATALAVTLAAAALLSACAGTPEPAPGSTETTAPNAEVPAPEESTAAEAPASSAGEPTCDTIIPAATVADFESIGWTSRTDPLYIGSIEAPDGIQCTWADFDGPGGDNLQMFGWGHIDAQQAADAQAELVSQGWLREDSPEGVYITEHPDTTIATDENGFGMTYLFGDGWVEFADTRQGLILVAWPPSS